MMVLVATSVMDVMATSTAMEPPIAAVTEAAMASRSSVSVAGVASASADTDVKERMPGTDIVPAAGALETATKGCLARGSVDATPTAPQRASAVGLQMEMVTDEAPLQALHAAHGAVPAALHVLPAMQLAVQTPPTLE